MYTIDPEKCTFCKDCLEECPTGAIVEGKAGDKDVCVVTSECIDCGSCEDACGVEALSYKE